MAHSPSKGVQMPDLTFSARNKSWDLTEISQIIDLMKPEQVEELMTLFFEHHGYRIESIYELNRFNVQFALKKLQPDSFGFHPRVHAFLFRGHDSIRVPETSGGMPSVFSSDGLFFSTGRFDCETLDGAVSQSAVFERRFFSGNEFFKMLFECGVKLEPVEISTKKLVMPRAETPKENS
jgi:hypothetical protein